MKPDYEVLFRTLMHEARTISLEALNHAAEASKALAGKGDLGRANLEVQAFGQLLYELKNWLDITDLEIGNIVVDPKAKVLTSIHGIFYRAWKMLRPRLQERKMTFQLQNFSERKDKFVFMALPIMSTLPYLLLDNAIKYGAAESVIDCSLCRVDGHIIVDFRSHGPALCEGEDERVFEFGFRGQYARQASPIGEGRGLALARMIARLHDIDISATSKQQGYYVGGTDFGVFAVKLTFPACEMT